MTEAQRATWASQASAFLGAVRKVEQDEQIEADAMLKSAKEERVASFQWLAQVNWMVMCAKGHTLLQYRGRGTTTGRCWSGNTSQSS